MLARCLVLLGAGCVLFGASSLAYADERPTVSTSDADVAHLEALFEQQQIRINNLKQQLAAESSAPDAHMQSTILQQQLREIMGSQEFREEMMPAMLQAGYDKGFFLRSSDDKFKMTFTGRLQFRFTHYGTQARNHYLMPRLERDDRTGFDIARMRFQVKGHVYSPDLTYLIQLRADAGDNYDVRERYAYVNYRFCDPFQVQLGIFKLAATRAQMMSSGKFQFVDRPMTDAVFSLGTGLGVRFWGRALDKRLDWYVDVVNSLYDFRNRVITTDDARELDNNPAVVGRLVWHALGDDPGDLMKSESDISFHETPALDLGVHYAFNDDAGDARTLRIPFRRSSTLPGAYLQTNSNGLQVNQVGVDAAFQWHGFSTTVEYMWRFLDPRRAGRVPFAPYWQLTGDGSDSSYHGGYAQFGYFLPIPGHEDKVELVGRVGGVSSIGPGSEGTWEYAGGLNYYFKDHNVKLQTDVTRIYEAPVRSGSGSIANLNDDALVWRVQLQFAF